MRRLILLVPLAALTLLAAAPTAPARDPGPTAHAAVACPLSIYRAKHLGTTYVKALRQHGTKCRHARKLVKAYNACRHENGRAGRCHHTVYDYDCGEHRYNKSPFSYDAKVKCTKGSREVSWRYTQNT
jgi:hypothetical protein